MNLTIRYAQRFFLRIDVAIAADVGGIPQVLIQFDTTNLTSDLSNATFTVIPDTYRDQEISAINSIAAELHE